MGQDLALESRDVRLPQPKQGRDDAGLMEVGHGSRLAPRVARVNRAETPFVPVSDGRGAADLVQEACRARIDLDELDPDVEGDRIQLRGPDTSQPTASNRMPPAETSRPSARRSDSSTWANEIT